MKKFYLIVMILIVSLNAGEYDKNLKKQAAPLSREERIVRYLDLTDQQQFAIRDLRLKFEREMIMLKTKANELQTRQKLEITSDNPDRGKLQKMVEEQTKIQKEMRMKNIDLQLSIRKILTENQRLKFDSWLLKAKRAATRRPKFNRYR